MVSSAFIMTDTAIPASIDDTQARLLAHDYVADRQLAAVVFLALRRQRKSGAANPREV